jgi:hypothetical protein
MDEAEFDTDMFAREQSKSVGCWFIADSCYQLPGFSAQQLRG